MVLKLRESQLAQLQRNVPISDSQEIASLREEVRSLKQQVEHHPDVTKFAMENLELRRIPIAVSANSLHLRTPGTLRNPVRTRYQS